MGKHQHGKDRLFVTRTEHEELFGGRRGAAGAADEKERRRRTSRRPPISVCALTLQPLRQQPVASPDGTVFEKCNLAAFVEKNGNSPVTGRKMLLEDAVPLIFARNQETGRIQCPVLFKDLETPHIKVVAIRTSGNVYSWEAVNELNLKPRSLTDLISGEIFTKRDILVLQDPERIQQPWTASLPVQSNTPASDRPNLNPTAQRIVKQLNDIPEPKRMRTDAVAAVAAATTTASFQVTGRSDTFTTGSSAIGLTSTVCEPETRTEMRKLTLDETLDRRYARVLKSKNPRITRGYATMRTSLGRVDIELYCKEAPRACDNFLSLVAAGRYDGVGFHRVVRGFVAQGGDPTGTGFGGENIWALETGFRDEFHPHLTHDRRGLLSMANSGPNTNKSQFFFTLGKSSGSLDNKHTIFGEIVGGEQVLDAFNKVEVDKSDRPLDEISIVAANVVSNPFEDPKPAGEKPELPARRVAPNRSLEIGKYLKK